ncbi:amino acid ABC transporter substrate-binding protein [Ruminococcus sp. Marseille-P6503]|uniref:amino acid ABC transporter substrate-binding protein n=1 Tax=Ruminococcus sp. Marseille-P6503 TaxID=2364796 RepID=UPI000F531626|nr:amino acid ABC transporter substrate-binding protein [Ruminococcus sp. Marseille-P6503]
MKKCILSAVCAAVLMLAGCGASDSSNADSASASGSQNAAGEDQSLQKVLDNGKLVLGLDATFKPMGYTDENDQIVGFDIDVASEVCSRLGVTLETYGVNWDTKEVDLDAGTIDCIWNGLSVSEERQKVMLMSEPYMKNKMVFVVNSGSDIASLDDLKGKTVSVQNGSTAQETLAAADISADITVTELSTNVEALNQLELGMCDAAFLDSVVADYEINSGRAFKILDEGLYEEDYAIGFRLGDKALCDKISEILGEMKADGKLAEISTKWFGSDVTTIG